MTFTTEKIKFCVLFLGLIISNKELDSIDSSVFSYELNTFDLNESKCKTILDFNHSSELNFLYLNDDESNQYSRYSKYSTDSNYQIMIAVRNRSELILITKQNDSIQNIVIKKFDTNIKKILPEWFFGRIFVLTHNSDSNITSIFEIDLFNQLIARLHSFKINSVESLFWTADVFQGTLTYSIENKLFAINIMYPSDSIRTTLPKEPIVFQENPHEKLLSYNATCKFSSPFDFILASSHIDGLSQIEFYYVKTKESGILKCALVESECNCMKPSNESQVIFNKIYTYYRKNHCQVGQIGEKKYFQTFKSFLNSTSFNNDLKQCLKICQISDMKMSIYNATMSSLENYNLNSDSQALSVHTENYCFNSLELDSNEFGLAKMNSSSLRLKIMWTKYFFERLTRLSGKCSKLEMMLKYIVKYKKISGLKFLNRIEKNYEGFTIKSSLETEILLDIEANSNYEIVVFIQTPFDRFPYKIGTYYLEENMKSRYTEPNYKNLLVKPTPFLYMYRYIIDSVEFITDKSIEILVFVQNKTFKNNHNMFYILTEEETGLLIVENLKILHSGLFNYSSQYSDLNHIAFKIENLKEDTTYYLRVLDKEKKSSEISSVSNLIRFKTLKKPSINITYVDDKRLEIEIEIKCKLTFEDTDLNDDSVKQKLDPYNICDYFNISWSLSNFSLIKYQKEHIFDRDLKDKNSMIFISNFTINNLSPDTNYSIQVEAQYINSFCLSSQKLDFKTSEKKIESSAHTSDSEKNLTVIVLVVILLTFAFIIAIGKKRKKLLIFKKRHNEYNFDNIDLEKLRPNTLYSWKLSFSKKWLYHLEGINKIKEKDLILSRLIGKGNYGYVYEGKLISKGEVLNVAIKKLKDEAIDLEKSDLVKEAVSLSSFNHPNLIKLYGICIHNESPKYIILEYMNLGDLLSYLRNDRKKKTLTFQKGLNLIIDITKGCVFLESIRLVHRDLAARNCLVMSVDSEDNEILVKIGDFGLAREVYSSDYYKQGCNKLLPIRWMSPEAIFDGIFTTKSDVWSFGIILWEILTLGCQPYPGMDNKQVIEYVRNKGINQIDDQRWPIFFSNIMLQCWTYDAKERISFKAILKQLENITNISDEKISENISLDSRKSHPSLQFNSDSESSFS